MRIRVKEIAKFHYGNEINFIKRFILPITHDLRKLQNDDLIDKRQFVDR